MPKKVAAIAVALGFLLLAGGTAASASPAPEPFIVGKARVTALQDMPGTMPLDIFRGAGMEAMKAMAPSGSVPAGVTVFLIQNGGRNLLVDTGYGLETPGRESALPVLLQQVGLGPDGIDTVLLTHMHGDHIGGLVKNGAPAFPKAVILASAKELAFWTDPDLARDMPALERNARMVRDMVTAYGDKVKPFAFGDIVAGDITAVAATGHTPGHAAFSLDSEGERLLFWGDTVHGAALQFADPDICAKYDMDMPQAVKTRREIFDRAAGEKIPVAGAHLPFPAIGRVTKNESGGEFTFTPGL